MYILLEACQHPAVLRFIYFGTLILDIISVLIPISLIIMLLIDFAKAVIANDEGAKKSTKLVTKRIMYAVIIFIVPWIVNLLITILSNVGLDTGTNYTLCLTNAQSGNFEYYDSLLEAEEKLAAEKRKIEMEKNKQDDNDDDNDNGGGSGGSGSQASNAMADELVNIIKREIGKTDRTKYGSPAGTPWCAYFVTWGMKKTEHNGVNLYYDIIQKEKKVQNPASAGCTIYNFHTSKNLKFYYSKHYAKKYNKQSYTPKPGDTIYFTWDGYWNGKIGSCGAMFYETSHIGFVRTVKNGKVYTIEGNCTSSSKVCSRSFDLNSSSIMGYGSWYNN